MSLDPQQLETLIKSGGRRISRRGNKPCECWDCVRARGYTPKRQYASRHRDVAGKIYRTDNGAVDRSQNSSEKEHARSMQTDNRPEKQS